MKRNNILLLLLLSVLWVSCDRSEDEAGVVVGNESVNFSAVPVKQSSSRSGWEMNGITVIAPGYGVGAPDQVAEYNVLSSGEMEKATEKEIKWSAKNMMFAAWYAPAGVDVDNGTVNFTKDLEDLIGSHATSNYVTPLPSVEFKFYHLAVKLSITLINKANADPIQNASIIFPAIKEVGTFKTSLTEKPVVSFGRSGNELSFGFVEENTESEGKAIIKKCYLPPLTGSELLMYGSFTVKVGETTYVGTLYNLGVEAINAGDHLSFEIHINDDHTALLQAVTLAPWDVYPDNIYNRPYAGIWGLEDLEALSEIVNQGGGESSNGMTMDNFADKEGVIRLYTTINASSTTFDCIGTPENPFEGYTFDGNGYAISGLYMMNTSKDNQGLFGVVGDNAVIRNVKLEGAFVEGQDNVGLLVGQSVGNVLIDHCFISEGRLLGRDNVGGLIGVCGEQTVIRNCGIAPRTISGSNQVGGFVGVNRGTIGNSYSNLSGNITCVYVNAGGFVGTNEADIRNCYSVASFTGSSSTGCGAWAGSHPAGAQTTSSYWNTEAIDNSNCSRVIGDNELVDDYGVEKLPSNVSAGRAFNKSNGRLVNQNNTYELMRDYLNNYIISNSSTTAADYLQWAVLTTNGLPVFSY